MRVKSKKKKIIFSVILVVLVFGILFIYNAFNGNPVSKAIERKKFQTYIEKTYPGTDFKIDKMYFDFKFADYGAKVVSKEKGYEFDIISLSDGTISDQYKDMPMLVDYELTMKFTESINYEITKVLKNKLNLSNYEDTNDDGKSSLFISMDVEQGKYKDKTIEYSNDLDDKFAIGLSIPMQDEKDYKEKLCENMQIIRDFALKQNYKGLVGIYVTTTTPDDMAHCLVLNGEELKTESEKLDNFIYQGVANFDTLNKASKIDIELYDGSVKEKERESFEEELKN